VAYIPADRHWGVSTERRQIADALFAARPTRTSAIRWDRIALIGACLAFHAAWIGAVVKLFS
jgi:hypothetical protein